MEPEEIAVQSEDQRAAAALAAKRFELSTINRNPVVNGTVQESENPIQSATDENVSELSAETPPEGTEGEDDGEIPESDDRYHAAEVRKIVKERVEKVRQKTREQVLAEKEEEVEYWRKKSQGHKIVVDPLQLPEKPQAINYASNPTQYEKDLEAWTAKKVQVDNYKNNIQQQYVNRSNEFAKTHPDFQKSVSFFSSVTVPPVLEAQILESEVGPQIAYYLSKNYKEFDRISSISSPATLVKEIGKLELQLTGQVQTQPVVKKPTAKPIKPVSGGGAPPTRQGTFKDLANTDKQAALEARKQLYRKPALVSRSN
jgi:hypothetical protein